MTEPGTEPGGPPDDEPVPKLPRGRGMKFSGPELFRIAMTIAVLIAVIVLAHPCANAVSTFVTGFGSGKGSAMPRPGSVDLPTATRPGAGSATEYVHLKGLTEEEAKAAIEREQARAKAGSDAPVPAVGSAPGPSSAP